MIAALLSIVTAIPAWLRAALVALLLVIGGGAALAIWFVRETRQIESNASATAKITERAAHQEEVLKNVEKAKRAIDSRDDARDHRLCEQDSRTPENC